MKTRCNVHEYLIFVNSKALKIMIKSHIKYGKKVYLEIVDVPWFSPRPNWEPLAQRSIVSFGARAILLGENCG